MGFLVAKGFLSDIYSDCFHATLVIVQTYKKIIINYHCHMQEVGQEFLQCKNTQAGTRSENTMFLRFNWKNIQSTRSWKACHKKPKEVTNLTTRCKKGKKFNSGFNPKSSGVAPMLLVQRAEHGLCFPKHK